MNLPFDPQYPAPPAWAKAECEDFFKRTGLEPTQELVQTLLHTLYGARAEGKHARDRELIGTYADGKQSEEVTKALFAEMLGSSASSKVLLEYVARLEYLLELYREQTGVEPKVLVLTREDSVRFVESFSNPREPTEKLKEAARRHSEVFASALDERARARNVSVNSSRELWLTLPGGAQFYMPVDALQGMADARLYEVQDVKLEADGTALRWPQLDLDFWVGGILEGRYGTKAWMESGAVEVVFKDWEAA